MLNETATSQPIEYRASERSFGWVMVAFFSIIGGVLPLVKSRTVHPVLLIVAGAFLGLTLFSPSLLRWPNYVWGRIGMLLHRVVNPVVLGVIYFGIFTPLGLVMRTLNPNFFDTKIKRDVKSYWQPRSETPGSSMKNQF